MSISDWSSDFCSSDLEKPGLTNLSSASSPTQEDRNEASTKVLASPAVRARAKALGVDLSMVHSQGERIRHADLDVYLLYGKRSEEHTSELQSLMRISYAVFCLKKKKNNITIQ